MEKQQENKQEPKLFTVTAGGKTAQLTEEELLLCASCVLAAGDRKQEEFTRFVEKYPDVREFPQEVEQRISAGESPLDAYREYELTALRAKLAALEKNEQNIKKSTGSAASDAGELETSELDAIYNAVFGH